MENKTIKTGKIFGHLFIENEQINDNEEKPMLPLGIEKPKLKERKIDEGESPMLPTGIKEKDPRQNK